MKLFFFPAWEPLGKVRILLLQPGFPLMATFLISRAGDTQGLVFEITELRNEWKCARGGGTATAASFFP